MIVLLLAIQQIHLLRRGFEMGESEIDEHRALLGIRFADMATRL